MISVIRVGTLYQTVDRQYFNREPKILKTIFSHQMRRWIVSESTKIMTCMSKIISRMESEMKLEPEGHWTTLLPFKKNKPAIPNNKVVAIYKLLSHIIVSWKKIEKDNTILHSKLDDGERLNGVARQILLHHWKMDRNCSTAHYSSFAILRDLVTYLDSLIHLHRIEEDHSTVFYLQDPI